MYIHNTCGTGRSFEGEILKEILDHIKGADIKSCYDQGPADHQKYGNLKKKLNEKRKCEPIKMCRIKVCVSLSLSLLLLRVNMVDRWFKRHNHWFCMVGAKERSS